MKKADTKNDACQMELDSEKVLTKVNEVFRCERTIIVISLTALSYAAFLWRGHLARCEMFH